MSECEHKYIYQGAVYRASHNLLPGSGARSRIYFDRYFCECCLNIVDRNERHYGNTYENPIAGSVPLHDGA